MSHDSLEEITQPAVSAGTLHTRRDDQMGMCVSSIIAMGSLSVTISHPAITRPPPCLFTEQDIYMRMPSSTSCREGPRLLGRIFHDASGWRSSPCPRIASHISTNAFHPVRPWTLRKAYYSAATMACADDHVVLSMEYFIRSMHF